MKGIYIMKVVLTCLIVYFFALGILLIGIGCNKEKEQPPSKRAQWDSQVEKWNNRGYRVLDTYELERLVTGHPSIARKLIDNMWFRDLGFLDKKTLDNDYFITRDYNGNTKIFGKEAPESPGRARFLSSEESIKLLEAEGYQVERNDNGYILKREGPFPGTIDPISIGWGVTMILESGTVVNTDFGFIRVKASETQQ